MISAPLLPPADRYSAHTVAYASHDELVALETTYGAFLHPPTQPSHMKRLTRGSTRILDALQD